MKQYFLLLRTNLKAYVNCFHGASIRKDNGKLDISRIVLYITVALSFLFMGGMVIFLETSLYRAADGLNLDRLLIGLALLISMITTLLFGLSHTLGAMYFNRETAAMAHLPITSRTQMAARWTEIYLGEILLSLALLTPILINHGIAQGAGVLYYARALLTLLITPLYPLSVALLLASLLGRVSSFTKHREVWVVIGTIVMVTLVVGTEMLIIPTIPDDADAMFFIRLLTNNEALLNFIIGVFPPVMWAILALQGDWLMQLLYMSVGVAAIALVIYLTGGSYMRVCLRHTEQGTHSKRVSAREKREGFEPRSPFKAVFFREMNEVLKTPIYLLNAVVGVLMMPIMILSMSVGISTAEEGVSITSLLDQLLATVSPMDITLILAGLLSIMCLVCPLASTAVSREGKRLPIMRMIPVAPRTILWAKLMVSVAIIGIGSVLMGAGIILFLGASYLPHVLTALLLSNLLSLAVSIGNLIVDVMRPLLDWKNENEVMKQNMNSLFGALIGMLMVALAVAPPIMMYALPAWSRFAAAAAIVLVELATALLLMRRIAEPRFAKLEP